MRIDPGGASAPGVDIDCALWRHVMSRLCPDILTFDHLPNWINEIKESLKYEIPILIVGNKYDLINQRVVSKVEIAQFTKEYNLHYTEISAKTGEGVEKSFHTLTRLMIEDFNNKKKSLMH